MRSSTRQSPFTLSDNQSDETDFIIETTRALVYANVNRYGAVSLPSRRFTAYCRSIKNDKRWTTALFRKYSRPTDQPTP